MLRSSCFARLPVVCAVWFCAVGLFLGLPAFAQEAPATGVAPITEAEMKAAAEAREKELGLDNVKGAAKKEDPKAAPQKAKETSYLEYYWKGGPLMHPILFMSIIVVTFSIERWLGLLKSRVLPEDLVLGLGQLANRKGGLDPRLAYRLCQKHRSTTANVIRAALLKVGRPLNEVEDAVHQAAEREANILYKNVRPIALAVSVTPLIGLLGTVLGMIEAFAITSESASGAKATELAAGIYVALITTVGGLVVAIPAAILAHYFEGRIQSLMRDVETLVETILPQLERYEGKLRITRWDASTDGEPGTGDDSPPSAASKPASSPAAPPAAAPSKN